MLPKPAELRDLSLRCRQAACKATDLGTKRRIAEHALALAQLAEQMEQRGWLGRICVQRERRALQSRARPSLG
jgi:hypothetical protein